MACFLLNNFIRNEMHEDPLERDSDEDLVDLGDEDVAAGGVDFIDTIENISAWSRNRDNIVEQMWTSYLLEQ